MKNITIKPDENNEAKSIITEIKYLLDEQIGDGRRNCEFRDTAVEIILSKKGGK